MEVQEKSHENTPAKRSYNEPKLTKHGHIRDITLASQVGATPDSVQGSYTASQPYGS